MKIIQYIAAILVIGAFSFYVGMGIAYLIHRKPTTPKVEEHSILKGRVPLTPMDIQAIYLRGWTKGCLHGLSDGKNAILFYNVDSLEFAKEIQYWPTLKADGHF